MPALPRRSPRSNRRWRLRPSTPGRTGGPGRATRGQGGVQRALGRRHLLQIGGDLRLGRAGLGQGLAAGRGGAARGPAGSAGSAGSAGPPGSPAGRGTARTTATASTASTDCTGGGRRSRRGRRGRRGRSGGRGLRLAQGGRRSQGVRGLRRVGVRPGLRRHQCSLQLGDLLSVRAGRRGGGRGHGGRRGRGRHHRRRGRRRGLTGLGLGQGGPGRGQRRLGRGHRGVEGSDVQRRQCLSGDHGLAHGDIDRTDGARGIEVAGRPG